MPRRPFPSHSLPCRCLNSSPPAAQLHSSAVHSHKHLHLCKLSVMEEDAEDLSDVVLSQEILGGEQQVVSTIGSSTYTQTISWFRRCAPLDSKLLFPYSYSFYWGTSYLTFRFSWVQILSCFPIYTIISSRQTLSGTYRLLGENEFHKDDKFA